jgi:hypothetical protein
MPCDFLLENETASSIPNPIRRLGWWSSLFSGGAHFETNKRSREARETHTTTMSETRTAERHVAFRVLCSLREHASQGRQYYCDGGEGDTSNTGTKMPKSISDSASFSSRHAQSERDQGRARGQEDDLRYRQKWRNENAVACSSSLDLDKNQGIHERTRSDDRVARTRLSASFDAPFNHSSCTDAVQRKHMEGPEEDEEERRLQRQPAYSETVLRANTRSWSYKPGKGFPDGDVPFSMENRPSPHRPEEQYFSRLTSSSSSGSGGSPMIRSYRTMDRNIPTLPPNRRHSENLRSSGSAPSTPTGTHRPTSWPSAYCAAVGPETFAGFAASPSVAVRPERGAAMHQNQGTTNRIQRNHPKMAVNSSVITDNNAMSAISEEGRTRKIPEASSLHREERRIFGPGFLFFRECDVKHPLFVLYAILVFLIMIKMSIMPHHRLMQSQMHEMKV